MNIVMGSKVDLYLKALYLIGNTLCQAIVY